VNAHQLKVLKEWGVTTTAPFDLCWLDCDQAGWLLTWPRRGRAECICLCPQHALILEQGRYRQDYEGAPLPPDSKAGAWPWRLCAEVNLTDVAG